jgi:peptide-methionine (R)-S-oxide reductase
MPHHRILFWPGASLAMAVLLAVSIASTSRGSFQATGKSAQDPFQVAEKAAADSTGKTDKKVEDKKKAEPEFVRKTDEEWAKILNPAVFRVTRWKETEPAFSGQYVAFHGRGTFLCACCNAELFDAQHKFDSGTGWPSFWRPISVKAVVNALDNSEAEQRIEVMCRRCGAHLGHVFDDNPAAPTGLRYCINSLSLKLKRPDGTTARTTSVKGKTKAKARTTVKTRSKTSSKTAPSSKATAKTTEPEPQGSSEEKPNGSKTPTTGN